MRPLTCWGLHRGFSHWGGTRERPGFLTFWDDSGAHTGHPESTFLSLRLAALQMTPVLGPENSITTQHSLRGDPAVGGMAGSFEARIKQVQSECQRPIDVELDTFARSWGFFRMGPLGSVFPPSGHTCQSRRQSACQCSELRPTAPAQLLPCRREAQLSSRAGRGWAAQARRVSKACRDFLVF